MTTYRYLNIFLLLFVSTVVAHSQNYEESKLPSYVLPDILKTRNARVIKDTVDWKGIRRAEILDLFQEHVYGKLPTEHDSINFAVNKLTTTVLNGKALLKTVTITIWRMKKPVDINLTVLVPVKRSGPVPLFLLINNRDQSLTNPHNDTSSNFWPAEMMIDSGYAMGAFHVSDAAPDQPDQYHKGVLRLYPEQLASPNGMKAIGAWAWAAIKALDYFQTDPDIDSRRVALVGHSRGGKAALWAGANDQRFAIIIANCSGNTGAAISRRKFGETIKVINERFPHWFADNYKKYNDNESSLPVDQHMLLALIAPRPLYTTNATKDLWADPTGSYLSVLESAKVYKLYKKTWALGPEAPAPNKAIIQSILGYHIREGIHDMTKFDWQQFASFARYHFNQ